MDWQNIIITVLGTVLTAFGTWLVTIITNFIDTKIKDIKGKNFLNNALEVVADAVKSTYQTYVESIKGTDAWNKETQQNALSNAVATAQTLLKTDVKEFIVNNYGDLTTWLKNSIEAKIYDLKKSNSVSNENI